MFYVMYTLLVFCIIENNSVYFREIFDRNEAYKPASHRNDQLQAVKKNWKGAMFKNVSISWVHIRHPPRIEKAKKWSSVIRNNFD